MRGKKKKQTTPHTHKFLQTPAGRSPESSFTVHFQRCKHCKNARDSFISQAAAARPFSICSPQHPRLCTANNPLSDRSLWRFLTPGTGGLVCKLEMKSTDLSFQQQGKCRIRRSLCAPESLTASQSCPVCFYGRLLLLFLLLPKHLLPSSKLVCPNQPHQPASPESLSKLPMGSVIGSDHLTPAQHSLCHRSTAIPLCGWAKPVTRWMNQIFGWYQSLPSP